jgi:hypothetical protein
METSHVFNEETKQFDPKETSCFYCGRDHAATPETNLSFPIYKEQQRHNLLVVRSVEYNALSIGIPRCEKCADLHNSANAGAKIIAWVSAAVIMLLSFLAWEENGLWSIIPAVLWGVGGSHLLEKWLVERKGIAMAGTGARQDALVAGFLANGWTDEKPNA